MNVAPASRANAVRQKSSSVALTGVVPQIGGEDCVPHIQPGGFYQYVHPTDLVLIDLSQGGLFDFGNQVAYSIREFRAAPGAGNITLVVEDRDGPPVHSVIFSSGSGEYASFYPPIAVLPSQVVKITTANAGTLPVPVWVDLYIVKATPL